MPKGDPAGYLPSVKAARKGKPAGKKPTGAKQPAKGGNPFKKAMPK